MKIRIKFCRTDDTDISFPAPSYETVGSSGMDLRACLHKLQRLKGIKIFPKKRVLIPTGFKVEIPRGYEGQIRARSGLALNFGIGLVNSVGTIDSDFRGELKVLLINFGEETFVLSHGVRIAQLVISPVVRVECHLVDFLGETDRNEAGFGSTGVS